MTYPESIQSIKSWAEKERPRERLQNFGAKSLSDAELIAILLGSGTQGMNVVDLARQILKSVDHNLSSLSRLSIADFKQFKGVGKAKAITLAAALELGRRRQYAKFQERPQIKSSQDAYDFMGPLLRDLTHEEFWVILLNQAHRIIGKEQVSRGGTNGTVVDARIIFKKAIQEQSSALILMHNHPSGQLHPSDADRSITKKLKKGGEYLEIKVLDHLIIAGDGYYSFSDEGVI
jgi:DNA repair protein RadC